MKKSASVILLILMMLCCSCSFIQNAFNYKATTKNFVDALLNGDNNTALSLLNEQAIKGQNIDTIKSKLNSIKNIIIQNFGTKLDYSFETATKTISTDDINNTPPNQTLVFIQISNGKDFGELKLLFDDRSHKITSFFVLNTKVPIPGMFFYWLWGFITLGALAFNIYVIVLVKRSKIKKKWLKYLAVIFLNLPTLGYRAVGGFFFSASIQFMLGISFYYSGYANSYAAFGIPLGSLFVFYKLKKQLYKTNNDDLTVTTDTLDPLPDDLEKENGESEL